MEFLGYIITFKYIQITRYKSSFKIMFFNAFFYIKLYIIYYLFLLFMKPIYENKLFSD